MALIKCEECGKELSDTANVCPHCGIETKRAVNNAIKFGILDVLIIILLVFYTGCILYKMYSLNYYEFYYITKIIAIWLLYLMYKFNMLFIKITTGIIILLSMIAYMIGNFSFLTRFYGLLYSFTSLISFYSVIMVLYLVILRRKNGSS